MVPAAAPEIGLRPSERTPSSSRRSPSFPPLARGWLTHAKGTAMDDVARVILAIGSQEVAEEVLHLLDRSGRARVVATAADDRQLAEAVRQLEPDAVVAEPAIAAAGVGSAALLARSEERRVGKECRGRGGRQKAKNAAATLAQAAGHIEPRGET